MSAHILQLDPRRVPVAVRSLIPFAAKYGYSDEMLRAELLSRAPASEITGLRKELKAREDDIDDWLGGAECLLERPSPEYAAFTNLRVGMAELLKRK